MTNDSSAAGMRWRHRFTVLTALSTLVLMGWGAFVTSIEAGLAVPDWPSSYDSYDPFNPWPGWWRVTPLLAEHGHRLLGMLVGFLTTILAVWTWFAESRRWLRWLAVGALALVSFQGLLGGLRVVWLSLDLAVVHAATAQLFLGLVVALAVFTSESWLALDAARDGPRDNRLWRLSLTVPAAVWLQIILGALLRHPGTGIHPWLVGFHVGGAVLVAAAVAAFLLRVWKGFRASRVLYRGSWVLAGLVDLQLILGLTAYLVTLDDAGMLQPSNLQVVVNTSHAVIGALLMAGAVLAVLGTHRWGRNPATSG
ncbi:MAG: cytochrome oxidase assembly protein [Acidobacteria bacterium]|nr:cytochrome oxidase assembly protein [Acidobacteriota bacterium]MYG74558.1 cytochrome oxidase assembly protein [Acidobacteriota bacterium]